MSDIFRDYSFGGWLKHYRIEKQIGLREMSRALGVDPSGYCKMEQSEFSPPKSRAKVIRLLEPLRLSETQREFLISIAYQHHLSTFKGLWISND